MLGGNKRFFEFMQAYNLNCESPNAKYKSKAAEFYRAKLKAEAECEEFNARPPESKEGREIIKALEELKSTKAGITQQYGNGIKKKGIFDKMIDAAKDFGEMTKTATENVSKSIRVSFNLDSRIMKILMLSL